MRSLCWKKEQVYLPQSRKKYLQDSNLKLMQTIMLKLSVQFLPFFFCSVFVIAVVINVVVLEIKGEMQLKILKDRSNKRHNKFKQVFKNKFNLRL